MPLVRYDANRDPRDRTEVLRFRNGTLELRKKKTANLTETEIREASKYAVLVRLDDTPAPVPDQPAWLPVVVEDQSNQLAKLPAEGGPVPITSPTTGSSSGAGAVGPAGPQGPKGDPGVRRFHGHGAPGVIIGAAPGDEYLDVDSGDLYYLG